MQTPRLIPSLHASLILAACLALGAPFHVRADNGDDEQGGDISGSENTHQKVTLAPGPSAPAGVAGKAELEAEDEDGTTSATLTIEPQGLPDGTYTVTVTLKSDTTATPVTLGQFDIATVATTGDGGGDGDVEESRHRGNDDSDSEDAEVKFGDEGTPFPAGFNPFDIATVSITDANSVVELTGDFTAVAADVFVHASVKVTPGPAATTAKGHAVFTARSKRGKVRSMFVLGAREVPKSSTFTVNVNGAPVGTVKSNRRGQVSIKAPKGLPGTVNPFTVKSVTLTDDSGAHVLDVNL